MQFIHYRTALHQTYGMNSATQHTEHFDVNEQTRNIAFQYLLFVVVKQVCLSFRWASLREFNERNNISRTKIRLYPFFIATANGCFLKMHNVFGPFFALQEGPVSIASLTYGMNYDLKYFSLENAFKVKLKEHYASWSTSVMEATISQELREQQNGKLILDAIHSSIYSLLNNTGDHFFRYDDSILVTIAHQQRTWAKMYHHLLTLPRQEITAERLQMNPAELNNDPPIYRFIPQQTAAL